MDLTPRLLTEVEFREEWRGYKRDDVDDFLARVAAALGELQERLRETGERAAQAERRLLERSDEDEIRRTLVLAQRTALTAVEEARAEAERVLADADDRARQRLDDAEARLAAMDEEMAERTRRDLGDLADRRAALEADVQQLTSFFEEHRARLRAELERQLAELDARDATVAVPEPPALHDVDLAAPTHEPLDVSAPEAFEAFEPPVIEPTVARAPSEEEVAQAREDLLEALRRAGVEDLLGEVAPGALLPDTPVAGEPEPQPPLDVAEPGAEAAEPTPELFLEPEPVFDLTGEPTPEPAPRLYDADDESGEISLPLLEPTGAYDALAPEAEDDDPGSADVEWRDASGPTPVVVDDDPFLTELRRAVTDTEPLGPRDAADVVDVDEQDDGVPSGRFLRRRGR
ncbi:MAG: DivIVA protein [Actinomycetia bacterium]|nr:DivIVA protein [Actinomycetes bacterium]